ncbi:MAG: ABC transporter ATP-binding protein [Ruminococcaceae bacterium]|nr:ABC transporter ATP-binding protein [Oscillospiraceae bacterium]
MMIKIDGLNKYYKIGDQKFHALKNVSFSLLQGDMVSIRGRSGAGKSTLLNILGCLDTFDNGTYFFDGADIHTMKDTQLANIRNTKIGFVLQNFSLINQKSVLFNTMLPLYFGKTPYAHMKKSALDILDRLGIGDQANKEVNQLSGGQRQRVAIARALITSPRLILADEPTGALDSRTSNSIMDLLEDLNKEGLSILIVTHDDNVAERCPRQYWMEDGVLIDKTK